MDGVGDTVTGSVGTLVLDTASVLHAAIPGICVASASTSEVEVADGSYPAASATEGCCTTWPWWVLAMSVSDRFTVVSARLCTSEADENDELVI